MKKLFAAVVFAALAVAATSYKVEVKVSENSASACDSGGNGC